MLTTRPPMAIIKPAMAIDDVLGAGISTGSGRDDFFKRLPFAQGTRLTELYTQNNHSARLDEVGIDCAAQALGA